MKKSFGHGQPDNRLAIQQLARGLAIVAGMAVLVMGCSKAKSPPGEVSVPAATASTNTASAASANPNTNGQPDLRTLNRQFILYEMQNHAHFATLEEYMAAANVQFPPPPTGKKYAIDKRGYIVLVNQ